MVDFLHSLGSNLPHSEHGDRMIWKLSKKTNFNVCSFYDKLRGPLPIIFPYKGIWKVKAPTHISFCGIEASILLIGALCAAVMGSR